MGGKLGEEQKILTYRSLEYAELDNLIDLLESDYGLCLRGWVDVSRPGFELGVGVSGKSVRLWADEQEFDIYTNKLKMVKDSIHVLYADSRIYQIMSDGVVNDNKITEMEFDPKETYALIFPSFDENKKRRVLALVRDDVKYTKFNY